MSDNTSIEWTDATWNPIRARRKDGQPNKGGGGWHCERVSPGCPMPERVVMFSGGIGSWAAAKRTVERYGNEGTVLLFTDTLIEDQDLYRFLDEAAADVGCPLVRIADGRTPWQVFKDRRMLGNSRIAPCSVELKQRPARAWMEANAPDAAVVVGIDWTEMHRLEPVRRGWAPFPVEAPLTEPPYRAKSELIAELPAGIEPPALYRMGFHHNNCGGGCVRAGHAQFAHLFRTRPEVFADWERGEEDMRQFLGADVAILRDRTGGQTKPYTLAAMRTELERQPGLFDSDDWGGCGCFLAEWPDDLRVREFPR